MTPEPAIVIDDLTRDFAIGLRGRRLRAVDHLSLRIEAGQIFGLLGPNGSGKSTAIKVLLDLLSPTMGECRIFGVSSRRVEARQGIGYLPESPCFHRYLTGRELVRFHGGLAGLGRTTLNARVEEVLSQVGLARAAGRGIGTYSKGMLQRVGLAQALVHGPRLLILDEPTAGMDLAGTEEITALLLKLKGEGRTVVIVSHLLAQMEEICDRVAIMDHGRLILEGRPSELADASAGFQALMVDPLTPEQLTELSCWLGRRGRTLWGAAPARSSLDKIFLQATRTTLLSCEPP